MSFFDRNKKEDTSWLGQPTGVIHSKDSNQFFDEEQEERDSTGNPLPEPVNKEPPWTPMGVHGSKAPATENSQGDETQEPQYQPDAEESRPTDGASREAGSDTMGTQCTEDLPPSTAEEQSLGEGQLPEQTTEPADEYDAGSVVGAEETHPFVGQENQEPDSPPDTDCEEDAGYQPDEGWRIPTVENNESPWEKPIIDNEDNTFHPGFIPAETPVGENDFSQRPNQSYDEGYNMQPTGYGQDAASMGAGQEPYPMHNNAWENGPIETTPDMQDGFGADGLGEESTFEPSFEQEPNIAHEDANEEAFCAMQDMYQGQQQGPSSNDLNAQNFAALFGEDMPELEDKRKIKKQNNREKRKAQAAEKKSKKKAQQEMCAYGDNRNSHKAATILLKIFAFLILVAVIGFQGMERLEKAEKLIGSAGNVEIMSHPNETYGYSGPEFNTAQNPSESDTEIQANEGREYLYIDSKMLDSKTTTELAVWYITEFENSDNRNENAFNEFEIWFEGEAGEDPDFDSRFKAALSYVKEHPELVDAQGNNADADKPEQENEVDKAEQTPSVKYSHIDEGKLNSSTATEVANWVYSKFPPESTNWDTQALAEYNRWLKEKESTNPSFANAIKGNLSIIGWTATGH